MGILPRQSAYTDSKVSVCIVSKTVKCYTTEVYKVRNSTEQAFHEKLIVAQLVKFPSCYGTQSFIAVFTRSRWPRV